MKTHSDRRYSDERATWRDSVACYIHKLAYRFSPAEEHDLVVRDAAGSEVFSIALCDSFVASGPSDGYTLHCRHYDSETDELLSEDEI